MKALVLTAPPHSRTLMPNVAGKEFACLTETFCPFGLCVQSCFSVPPVISVPNLVCDPNEGFNPTPAAWFNKSCYQLPAFGTAGQAGRHALYSQGLVNWDASVNKQWPFGENKSV